MKWKVFIYFHGLPFIILTFFIIVNSLPKWYFLYNSFHTLVLSERKRNINLNTPWHHFYACIIYHPVASRLSMGHYLFVRTWVYVCIMHICVNVSTCVYRVSSCAWQCFRQPFWVRSSIFEESAAFCKQKCGLTKGLLSPLFVWLAMYLRGKRASTDKHLHVGTSERAWHDRQNVAEVSPVMKWGLKMNATVAVWQGRQSSRTWCRSLSLLVSQERNWTVTSPEVVGFTVRYPLHLNCSLTAPVSHCTSLSHPTLCQPFLHSQSASWPYAFTLNLTQKISTTCNFNAQVCNSCATWQA